ncbi:MAG: branched-chain amino acid ABC transporter permease [Haloechinothrix sp.]
MRKAAVALGMVLGSLFLLLGPGATSAWAEGEAVQGILQFEGEPVAGVNINVSTTGDVPIGTATSDQDGRWSLDVPGPGEYKVSIDEGSLPEGIGLRFPDRQTLTIQVFEGQPKGVLFALGEPLEEPSVFARAPQLAFEGINFGLIIAMAALGLSLIFGTTGLVNFAHGELVTLGALLAWFGDVVLGWPLLFAGAIAVFLSGLAGWLQDRFFWGKLRQRGTGLIAMLVISIGLSVLIRHIYLYFFGGQPRPYADFQGQAGMALGPISATPKSIFSIVLATIVIVAVGIALLKTRFGKATRAVADNPALAASSGINVDGVIRIVWTVGTALAALAGMLLGVSQQVHWQSGFQILLLIFAGVILGGLGTAFGALVGSLVVGLFIQLSTLWVPPELKNVGALAILIIILLFRPQGILGRRERVG